MPKNHQSWKSGQKLSFLQRLDTRLVLEHLQVRQRDRFPETHKVGNYREATSSLVVTLGTWEGFETLLQNWAAFGCNDGYAAIASGQQQTSRELDSPECLRLIVTQPKQAPPLAASLQRSRATGIYCLANQLVVSPSGSTPHLAHQPN